MRSDGSVPASAFTHNAGVSADLNVAFAATMLYTTSPFLLTLMHSWDSFKMMISAFPAYFLFLPSKSFARCLLTLPLWSAHSASMHWRCCPFSLRTPLRCLDGVRALTARCLVAFAHC